MQTCIEKVRDQAPAQAELREEASDRPPKARNLIYTIEIHTWNAITSVSNVKTILELLEQKTIDAYFLQPLS